MADHDIAGNATGQADGSISSSGSGWMNVLTAKLAIALGLFCGTMLFAAIPLLLSRRSTGRRNLVRHVLTGLSCLGGGVFLATCFLHLVPEATEKMQDALESAGVKIDFPVPYAVIIGGFLLVLLLEQAIHSCSSLSGIDGHHLHGPPAIADLGPVPVPNYGSICREELDELERQQQPNGEVGVIRVVRPARAAATTGAAVAAAAGAAAVGCSAEVVVANHHQLDDSNSSVVVAAAAAAAANNANHANQRSVESAVANSAAAGAAGAACSTDLSRVAGDVPRSAVNHAATVTSVSDGEAAAATAVETLHGDGAARARAGSATAAAAAGDDDDDDDVLGNAGQATTDIRRDEAEQQTHLNHHDLATTNSGDSHAVGAAAAVDAAVADSDAAVADSDAAVTSVNTTTTTTTSTTTTTTANGSNVAVNAADTETVAPSPSSFSTTSSAAVAVSPVHSSSAAAVSPVHSSSSAGFGLSGPYLGPATAIGSDAGAAVTNLANNTVGNGSASTGAGLLEEGLLTVTAYHHHNHHHHHHNHDHDHHDHRHHHHHPSNNSKDSMSKLGVDTPALDATQSDSEDDDHFASVSTHGDPGSHSAFRAIVMVFALSLHSIFEGIAIGLQPSSQEVFQLFGAIVVHKCVIAVTLSTNLVSASTRLGYCAIFTCVTIFSAMAPLGIAIAIGLNSAPPMVNGVLQCIAAGTFVYITFFEILPHELNSRHTEGTRLYRILMLLAGIGLIIGIMLAFPDKD